MSKPEQAKAVIVHGTFQHLEPAVSSPSRSEQGITVAVHLETGGGQVDGKRWRLV